MLNEQQTDAVTGDSTAPGGKLIEKPSSLHLIVFPVVSTLSEWTGVEQRSDRESGQEWWQGCKSVEESRTSLYNISKLPKIDCMYHRGNSWAWLIHVVLV